MYSPSIGRSSQYLVVHRTPYILGLVATPSTMVLKINQLAHLQQCLMDPLIMLLFTATSRCQQLLSSTLKCHLKSGLVLSHPVPHSPWCRILNLTQKEVYGKPWFPAKHQKEGGLACALMRSGIVAEQHLRKRGSPILFLRSGQCAALWRVLLNLSHCPLPAA